jgi:hypothetical protein
MYEELDRDEQLCLFMMRLHCRYSPPLILDISPTSITYLAKIPHLSFRIHIYSHSSLGRNRQNRHICSELPVIKT